MNENPNANAARRGRRKRKQPTDFWREPALPDGELKVTPAADVTAAVRSLGPPPLSGQGSQAESPPSSRHLSATIRPRFSLIPGFRARSPAWPVWS